MKAPDARCRAFVADVVAASLVTGRGPGEVIADLPGLRGAASTVRADVASWSLRVLGARLRLERALGRALSDDLQERARALVAAAFVEAGVDVDTGGDEPLTLEQLRDRIDAIQDPLERLGVRAAAPTWLAAKFADAYGDDASAVLSALGEPPPRTVRCNLLRGSRDELQRALRTEGVESCSAKFAGTALHCLGTTDLFATRAFREGRFEQQDEASQLAIRAVAPPPRGRVLDVCAGSGGKTLGLAAALGNRGVVMATDVHAGRLRELRRRLGRAGADNVQVRHLDGDGGAVEAFAERCDRVFVDAPCSGTGSWRRRPQARTSVTASDLSSLVSTQRSLLARAARWLRPGARLVYATCSLLPEENGEQVRWLSERHPELELVRLAEILGAAAASPISDATGTFLQVRPDVHGCDGFFLAVLRRRRGA